MPDQQQQFDATIDRCAAAYHRVMADMPKNVGTVTEMRHQHKAFLAFAAELPILRDPDSFQLYIACIARGAAIGAIDIVDVGRFCHIAQTAMSIWKLANLTIPAAAEKQRQAQMKEEQNAAKQATPLPPKGNHPTAQDGRPIDKAAQYAIDHLPAWETQKQHFKSLRKRGLSMPSDEELRDNPLAALYFCQSAEWFLRKAALAADPPRPQPATKLPPDQPAHPHQAA